jgi:hypothetical protein
MDTVTGQIHFTCRHASDSVLHFAIKACGDGWGAQPASCTLLGTMSRDHVFFKKKLFFICASMIDVSMIGGTIVQAGWIGAP